MNHVLDALIFLVNNSDNSGVYYNIAKIILDNLDKVENISINDLADMCFVSASTISRFCRYVGCNSYIDFCDEVSRPPQSYNRTSLFVDLTKQSDITQHMIDSIDSEFEIMQKYLNNDLIDKLVNDIYNYKKIAIFGRGNSGYFARELQYNLMFNKKYTTSINNLSDQFKFIRESKEDTLIIIFTVSGQYLIPSRNDDISLHDNKLSILSSKSNVVCITKNPKILKHPCVNYIIQFGSLELKSNYYNYSFEFLVDLISVKYSYLINN